MRLTVEDWLSSQEKRTGVVYRAAWKAWEEHVGDPFHATRADVERWRDAQRERFSPATINRNLGSIASCYRYLELPSPVRGVKRLKAHSNKRIWLTSEQLKQLANAARLKGGRTELVIGCLLHGLRSQEVCDLGIGCLQPRGETHLLIVRGKGSKTRPVPALDSLVALIQARQEAYVAAGDDTTEPLILSRQGKRLTYPAIRYIVTQTAQLAGLPDITPHDIRASVADAAYRAGVDLAQIQALLGHTSINTTMTYIKGIEAEDNQALTAVFG